MHQNLWRVSRMRIANLERLMMIIDDGLVINQSFKCATLSDEIVIKSKEVNILLVIRKEYRSSWQYLTNKRATRKQLRTKKRTTTNNNRR